MGCQDTAHRLDTGFGTTTLDARTVYIARGVDFSNTVTHTAFLEAARDLGDGQALRLQLFGDTLRNDRFVSYGGRVQVGACKLLRQSHSVPRPCLLCVRKIAVHG